MKSNNKNGKKRVRRQGGRRSLAIALTIVLLLPMLAVCAYATEPAGEADALAPLTAFQDLMSSIVTIIGVVLSLWGVVQVGMSLQSHDPSQRSQGLLCLAGGILIAFAPMILRSIGINI